MAASDQAPVSLFFAAWRKRLTALPREERDIAEAFQACFLDLSNKNVAALFAAAARETGPNTDAVFSPGSVSRRVLTGIIGEDHAAVGAAMWRRTALFDSRIDHEQRMLRAPDWPTLYFERSCHVLIHYARFLDGGGTLEGLLHFLQGPDAAANAESSQPQALPPHLTDIFFTGLPFPDIFFPDWVSAIMDEGPLETSEELFILMRDHIRSRLAAGRFPQRLFVSALLQCANPIFHEPITAILREHPGTNAAATVVACCSNAAAQGVKAVLQALLDTFPENAESAVKALSLWIGLDFSGTGQERNALSFMLRSLETPDAALSLLNTGRLEEKRVAIRVVAAMDALKLLPWLDAALQTGGRDERKMALSLVRYTERPVFLLRPGLAALLAPASLSDEDLMIQLFRTMQFAVRNAALCDVRPGNLDALSEGLFTRRSVRLLPKELQALYELLRGVAVSLPGNSEAAQRLPGYPPAPKARKRKGEPPDDEDHIRCSSGSALFCMSFLAKAAGAPPSEHTSLIVEEILDDLCHFWDDLSLMGKYHLLKGCLNTQALTETQRLTSVKGVLHPSHWVYDQAWRILETVVLGEAETLALEELLSLDDGLIRRNAISCLARLAPGDLAATVGRLLGSPDANRKRAGEELRALLPASASSADTHDTDDANDVAEWKILKPFVPPPLPDDFRLEDIFCLEPGYLAHCLREFDEAMEANKDYAYADNRVNGVAHTRTIGEADVVPVVDAPAEVPFIDRLPLAHAWKGILERNGMNCSVLSQIRTLYIWRNHLACERDEESWLEGLERGREIRHALQSALYVDVRHSWKVFRLLYGLLEDCPVHERFQWGLSVLHWLLTGCAKRPGAFLPDDGGPDYPARRDQRITFIMAAWVRYVCELAVNNDDFSRFFALVYPFALSVHLELKHGELLYGRDITRAFTLGLIAAEDVRLYALKERNTPHVLAELTNPLALRGMPDAFKAAVEQAVHHVVSREIRRGELPTPCTGAVGNIARLEGAQWFARLMQGMSGQPLEVSSMKAEWCEGGRFAIRTAVFSYLLRVCFPVKDEQPESLRRSLEDVPLSEEQLITGALYAPQWIDWVAGYLEKPGLASACAWFAVNADAPSTAALTEKAARFSTLPVDEKGYGGFDPVWFNTVHADLGAKEFTKLSRVARGLFGEKSLRRAFRLADAALGNVSIRALIEAVRDKRDKEALRCLGVVPLSQSGVSSEAEGCSLGEACRRLSIIQEFDAQSAEFGAKRRESEGQAVAEAVEMLAWTAGFPNAVHFRWIAESHETRLLRHMTPRSLAENAFPESDTAPSVWLEYGDTGEMGIRVNRSGKILKSVPTAYAKHPYVRELKTVSRKLREYAFACAAELERTMCQAETFAPDEFAAMTRHPLVGRMLRALVIEHDGRFSFGEMLCASAIPIHASVRIAHPVALRRSGIMDHCVEKLAATKAVQPFNQLFRPVFSVVPSHYDDVSDASFAGESLQRLKESGWHETPDLQFVKFFPAQELEARLETRPGPWRHGNPVPLAGAMTFSHLKSGQAVRLGDVPEALYSEAACDMRAVWHGSQALPEVAEARAALARFTILRHGLGNAELDGHRVRVTRSDGIYTIDLTDLTIAHEDLGPVVWRGPSRTCAGPLHAPYCKASVDTQRVMRALL